jgi:hypothetical protein
MRSSKWIVTALLAGFLGACASLGQADSAFPMFGKNAKMRDVVGDVIEVRTNDWGSRYVVVKDEITGLRVYVRSEAATCAPGTAFRGTGHLTRASEKDFDATFHFHLTNPNQVSG